MPSCRDVLRCLSFALHCQMGILGHIFYLEPVPGHMKTCFPLDSVEERSKIVTTFVFYVSLSTQMTHEDE